MKLFNWPHRFSRVIFGTKHSITTDISFQFLCQRNSQKKTFTQNLIKKEEQNSAINREFFETSHMKNISAQRGDRTHDPGPRVSCSTD